MIVSHCDFSWQDIMIEGQRGVRVLPLHFFGFFAVLEQTKKGVCPAEEPNIDVLSRSR